MQKLPWSRVLFFGLLVVPVACGDSATDGDGERGDTGGIGDADGSTDGDESMTEGNGDGDGDGDGDTTGDGDGDGDPTGDGDGDPTGDGDGDGDPTTGDGDGDGDGDPCRGGGGQVLDFSYIWVANSTQNTVSRIDTTTLTELGRYYVRPDLQGNPSRTSVSLTGDVVVASRQGGVTKYWARLEDCVDQNGVPGIQTSSGAQDLLAWNMEECRAWYAPFPQYNVMRPMAWTSGTFNEEACTVENAKVWTTGAVANSAGSVRAIRIDGDSGQVDVELHIPQVCVGGLGPYGGAVDENNNFWFHSRDCVNPAPLVRVDADGVSYDVYNVPGPVHPYGITVDSNGRIWLAGYIGGMARFDPDTETFDVLPGVTGLGIQEDAVGRMWMAVYPWTQFRGVHAFDVDTMQIIKTIDMTQVTPSSRGISIDFEGYVWMVDQEQSAWKINPDTSTWQQYTGLTGPYTYSDMTGWGLKLVNPG